MTVELELPDDLTEDMEVLFINPYSPEDSAYVKLSTAPDEELKDIFRRTSARDPGFQQFEDKVGAIKTVLGLGGYLLGDDLIILYGDRAAMQKAHDALKDEYTCFFDTMAAFLEHIKSEDAVVTIEAPKQVLN